MVPFEDFFGPSVWQLQEQKEKDASQPLRAAVMRNVCVLGRVHLLHHGCAVQVWSPIP
jgi:hypothetical protein